MACLDSTDVCRGEVSRQTASVAESLLHDTAVEEVDVAVAISVKLMASLGRGSLRAGHALGEDLKRKDRVRLRELLAANRRLATVYMLKDDLKSLWN